MAQPKIEYGNSVSIDAFEKAPIRVLHVDDEVDFLEGAKLALEMLGTFCVDTASSVEEAKEKLEKNRYDAIVCDYMMPRKDALEFVKELRASGSKIPFIIFTGKSREDVAIEALNLGVDRYFSKIGRPSRVYRELAYGICQVVRSRRLEEARAKAEELYRNVVELSPDSIMIVDTNGVITSCNTAATEMLGLPRDKLVGRRFSDLEAIRDNDLRKYMNLFDSVLSGKVTGPLKLTYNRKDGTSVLVEIRVGLLTKDGNTTGVQAVSRIIPTPRHRTTRNM